MYLSLVLQMEKVTKNKNKYAREISLMKDMNKGQYPGFPKLIYYYSDKYYYYLVIDLLNSSLKDLKDSTEDQKFSIKTVTMIALQILQRLEMMHKHGYVHRDLKPANMMVGKSSKGELNVIYLIDFGLTKKQSQVSAIPHADTGSKVVGTAVYAGINAHLPGSNYYKKDDLESLMYVLCYLGTGSLPWKILKPNEAGLEKMLKIKMKISPYDLFSTMPVEYAQIMDHIKTTPNDGSIDYRYIEDLFKQVGYNQKFRIDNRFDWLTPAPKTSMAIGGLQSGVLVQAAAAAAANISNPLIGANKNKLNKSEEHAVSKTPSANQIAHTNPNATSSNIRGVIGAIKEEHDNPDRSYNNFPEISHNNATMTIMMNTQNKMINSPD